MTFINTQHTLEWVVQFWLRGDERWVKSIMIMVRLHTVPTHRLARRMQTAQLARAWQQHGGSRLTLVRAGSFRERRISGGDVSPSPAVFCSDVGAFVERLEKLQERRH